MSDLISRSDLLKEIEKYKFGAISNDVEREYIKKTILDFIIGQPTAYSVDKVVAELEKLKSQVPVNRILDDIIKDKPKELGQLIAYGKAIEIVKASGKND